MRWPSFGRRLVVPAYLAACLILGGASAAGFLANLLLQLIGLGLIGWALLARGQEQTAPSVRSLNGLGLALLAVMVLQLVPLPPAIWTALPNRAPTAAGYALLGLPLPWLPLSLAPDNALASLLWFIPAVAVWLAMTRLGAFKASWIATTILGVTAFGVLLGALQVVGGEASPWYFYDITNYGHAVAFFANSNHAATLLVVAIPFLGAMQLVLAESRSIRRKSALLVITTAAYFVIAVGLVTNFSLAGLGLAVPVSIASFLLLKTGSRMRRWIGGVATALVAIAAVLVILLGPVQNNLTDAATGPSSGLDQLSRRVSVSRTLAAAATFAPVGSGVGSFQAIYRTLEPPNDTINTYMNHAHSDLAEVLLETGAVGALLLLLLLAWWGRRAYLLWTAETPDYFARAATIASGAILGHSLVDYPLRTAAIAVVFVICLGLMAQANPFATRRRDDGGARHFVA